MLLVTPLKALNPVLKFIHKSLLQSAEVVVQPALHHGELTAKVLPLALLSLQILHECGIAVQAFEDTAVPNAQLAAGFDANVQEVFQSQSRCPLHDSANELLLE